MRPRLRRLLFLLSALVLTPAAILAFLGLPGFGNYPGPYGDIVNHNLTRERHVTNMVAAVNFDVRGFDTLGEEFILLAAVTGVVILLRGRRGEDPAAPPGRVPGREPAPPSEATVLVSRWTMPLTLLFGIYVVLHAALTPGGGFQGGVIVASSCLLLYLGEGYRVWRRLLHGSVLEAIEGLGCAVFALAGFGGMLAGHSFLENVLPFGKQGSILSGGIIPVVNLGVGFAVAAGFAMLFLEFLEETREEDEDAQEGER